MLVAVTGFGSVWRHRLGRETHRRGHVCQPVYYNTTGVVVNGAVRQRPQICGYARFDAIGGFNPNRLSRMVNHVFECAEPSMWMGCNKLLFRRVLKSGERPDAFLVVAKSDVMGQLSIRTEGWRCPDSWLLSFSECACQQEAMLVLPAQGWIRSELGQLVLSISERHPWVGRMVLSCGG